MENAYCIKRTNHGYELTLVTDKKVLPLLISNDFIAVIGLLTSRFGEWSVLEQLQQTPLAALAREQCGVDDIFNGKEEVS